MYLQISRTIKSPIAFGTRIPWAIVWAFFSMTLSLFPSWNAFYKELDYNNKMKKDKQNVCKKEKITNLDYWGAPLSLHCNHFGKWSFDPSDLQ